MDDSLAVMQLSNQLKTFLQYTPKKEDPLIVCIGTDRATGDSLGPLTGWKLQALLKNLNIKVFGTIDHPVHAANLTETVLMLADRYNKHPIIAVDACLGHFTNVGSIVFHHGSLKPGTAMKKSLPAIGDAGITGIVNVGGFMEFQVLQNTRLSIVLKMSQLIANSIFLALHSSVKKTSLK